MKRTKKSVFSWAGEALLIFLSIMLAFYFENYRERHSRETVYINQLKDFHFDLMGNQRKMVFDLKQPDGVFEERFGVYDSLIHMFSRKDRQELPQILYLLRSAETPLAKWFFQSPHLDLLMTDHYAFIKNVELKRTMSVHKRRMQFIDRFKDEMKIITERIHPIYDQLDLDNPASAHNSRIIFTHDLNNLIMRLERKVWQLRDQYLLTKQQDSLIAVQIEHELTLWDEALN